MNNADKARIGLLAAHTHGGRIRQLELKHGAELREAALAGGEMSYASIGTLQETEDENYEARGTWHKRARLNSRRVGMAVPARRA